ncbi:MAG: aldehyde ferredoxin oxidoreductase N-terminal domain-containing protein [Chloroflexota bacterium]
MSEVKFKLLEVDLTKETSRAVDVTEDVKKYLGAKGLANKLIWDNVPKGVDPLSPDNVMHVGVGPLTGLVGCKTILSFKSPLTDWAGRSAVSGYVGEEIIRTQYNAGILIKGRAKRPSYLYVYNDDVKIMDATDLWGKWKQDTESTIRDRLNAQTGEMFGVLCIGPAGENLVRCANVSTEYVHSASKWGCGAVMGSKNLKAVAVKGTKGPLYADHKKVWELFRTYAMSPRTALHRIQESRWGHYQSPASLLRWAAEGVKNNHLGYHDVVERSSYLEHNLKYQSWTDGCPGCAACCEVPYFKNSPNGVFAGEFRHDNVGGFNANIMVGFEEMSEIAPLENELGMDGEELGGIVAFAIDLYQNGIITKEDLGGLELPWGSKEAVFKLLKKIAYREGKAANALADGFRRAYKVFGEKAIPFGWEVHGAAAPTYDVRNKQVGNGLVYGTSHAGARMGTGLDDALAESITYCIFAATPWVQIMGSREEVARQLLNPVCGWNLSLNDVNDIKMRNYYFNRCVSLREGYHPAKDDYLPPRAFSEPITDKYGNTHVWKKDEWEQEKKKYYVSTLKLTEGGLPPRAELKRLGLDFVIPVLDPMNAVG